MAAKRILLTLALAVLAGGGWFAWRTHADTAEATRRLGEVQARREALQRTPKPATSPRAAPASPAIASQARPSDPPGQSAASPAPKPPPGMLDLVRVNPQITDLFVASQRSHTQQNYGVLFRDLQLSAEQQEKFKDVWAAHITRSNDLGVVALEKGLPLDDPGLKQLHEKSRQQMESELRELLGEKAFAAYQDYERSLPVRGFVEGFAIQLATIEPLTPQQADQLARALVEASPEFRRGERASTKTVEWASVDAAAQRFLSPLQFASWQLGVAHNRAGGSRIDQELTRIYEAAKARDAKPPGN